MLRDSDLNAFVELVRRLETNTENESGKHPRSTLSSESQSNGLLHRAECFQLWRALKLASTVGDVPDSCHRLLRVILDAFPVDHQACLPLTRASDWIETIWWAKSQGTTTSPGVLAIEQNDRESRVGAACGRLRKRGYPVPIGVHGPDLSESTRKQITTDIDALVAQCGGINTLRALFAFMGQARTTHDGMWLFGIGPSSTGRSPDSAVPVAWLISLALRHIEGQAKAPFPTTIWENLIGLATDFAASMDCQRYSQFEDLNAEPHDFLRILDESLKWRELFTLPQAPPSTLKTIRSALLEASWPDGLDTVHSTVDGIFNEVDALVEGLSSGAITETPRTVAQTSFPHLWRHALGRTGKVNNGYLDPFGTAARNHERFVFFEVDEQRVIVLSPAMAAANACEALFRLVWRSAGDAASDLVGEALESAVARACREHTSSVGEGLRYEVNKSEFEMDIVVQERQEIILFETKAKSLTSRSRAGDVVQFIDDYVKSFLALLRQLVRHERHVRACRSPLDLSGVDPRTVRVTKVAVSPLSYGPAADHSLAGILFRSIAQARLHPRSDDGELAGTLDAFNKTLELLVADIEAVAPRRNGAIDLFPYMLDVFWLDLGELLYVLQRGRSVLDAVSPLRRVTFGTRDFWTEAASADRQGLTNNKWHGISTS